MKSHLKTARRVQCQVKCTALQSHQSDIGTTVPGGVASVNGNQSMPGQKAKKKR
ncbi:hypothetical protein SERLA73DRAFT_187132 [Serpula lacrymans var. lacrymans S7.3]|uniref:Uncharacterized protein n=1 Tax=Serpula lacrymans var. lacrymans (strain S7.3) TaxID=936435 RepID=F8Q8J1_SERL3|nr:hypothetical protein SERLA73DRAFT_187132 [Serpula lacrymans var. lacrymans S7.3]